MRPSELDAVPTELLLDAVRRRLEVVDHLEAETKKAQPAPELPLYGRLEALIAVASSVTAQLQEALSELPSGAVAELGWQHETVARRYTELQRLYQVRLEVTRAALDRSAARVERPQSPCESLPVIAGDSKSQEPV
jgi:hypothetical protein